MPIAALSSGDTTRADPPARPRRTWPPFALALGCAAAYVVFFALPYLANRLYRYPLHDVAIGYHDPSDLWPLDSAIGGVVFGTGGLLTLLLGPFVTVGALAWCAYGGWRGRHDRRCALMSSTGALVALGTLLAVFSPFGQALTQWWLD